MNNQTVQVKLKLPSEVVVHLPAFSDISLEECFKAASTHGVALVRELISEEIAREIVRRNRTRITAMVNKKVSDIELNIISAVVE